MSAVYTPRSPESFNYDNDSPSSSAKVKNSYGRKSETPYLGSTDGKQRIPSSSPFPESAKTARNRPELYRRSHGKKSEMSYSSTEGKNTPEYKKKSASTNDPRQRPISGILKNADSPSQKRVTVYLLTSINEDHSSPSMPNTPSSPVSANKKKPLVSFDTKNHHVSNTSGQSKAKESIERSMNRYRFTRK